MIIREKIFNTVEYYHYDIILYTVPFQDTVHCALSRYCTLCLFKIPYNLIIQGQEMSDKTRNE